MPHHDFDVVTGDSAPVAEAAEQPTRRMPASEPAPLQPAPAMPDPGRRRHDQR